MYLTTQPCLKGWTFRWIRMFVKVSFIEEDIGYQRIVRLEPSLFMEFIFILWPMWSIESQQITQRKRLRYRWLNKRSNSHTSENDQSLRIERQSQWGPRARKLFKSVWFAKQEEWSGSPDGGSSREPTSWLRICWSQRLQSLLTGMEKVLLVSYWLVLDGKRFLVLSPQKENFNRKQILRSPFRAYVIRSSLVLRIYG